MRSSTLFNNNESAKNNVHSDLQKERDNKCSYISELVNVLDGEKEITERRRKIG